MAILKPGDLDPALADLQAIYQEELFGAVSEEKSVEGITSKLFEAKTIKGYLTYKIMAQYISPERLGALVHPLKTVRGCCVGASVHESLPSKLCVGVVLVHQCMGTYPQNCVWVLCRCMGTYRPNCVWVLCRCISTQALTLRTVCGCCVGASVHESLPSKLCVGVV